MNIEKTIVVEKVDEVFLRINCSLEQGLELKSYLTCYAANYRWAPKFKARLWDGKISFFNLQSRTIPYGLLKKFEKFCEEYQYPAEYMFDRTPNDLDENDIQEFYGLIFKDSKFIPRDYQNDAIIKAINNEKGVLELATGAGKSLVIYSLIRYLMEATKGKILLVVPTVMLVKQMFSDFVSYGWKDAFDHVSILYSDKDNYDATKRIQISTWQSIYKKEEQFFEKFGSVIIDECHTGKSNSIRMILEKCKNARFRIGTTGTLPTEKVDKYTIFGYLGPILATVKSAELIDRGVLSDIEIVNVFLRYGKQEIDMAKKMKYAEEERFTATHPHRNKVISFVLGNISEKENSLVLCSKIEHLESVVEHLKQELPGRKIVTIHGAIGFDDREEIRVSMENEEGTILVGSYGTMKMGVNIKKIHNVIFASSYKSKITVLQSIGRGLRKHDDKTKMRLWDIIDDLRYETKGGKVMTNYLYDHFIERVSYYKDQGFRFINKTVKLSSLINKEKDNEDES